MHITLREKDDVIIMDLEGEIRLDDPSGSSLLHMVKCQLETGKKNILLNFSGLDFVDSSGIGEIVGSHVSARNRGAKLKIANVPEKIMLILKYSALTNVVEIFEDEASALSNFHGE